MQDVLKQDAQTQNDTNTDQKLETEGDDTIQDNKEEMEVFKKN